MQIPEIQEPMSVEVNGLVKRFGATCAVAGLDMAIQSGETMALLGPNGAGKSTTIGVLLGLLKPDAGEVSVFGQQPRQAVASGRVGVMLQDAGLMPGVLVDELLGFVRSRYAAPLSLADLIDTAGLHDMLRRRVDHLSGGQAQRVRFALAIAGNPDLLVLDEPTAAMDIEGRRAFWERMRQMADAGKTILFATHYLEEADMAADRIIVIAHGRKVADGTAREIKESLGEHRVRFTLDRGQEDQEARLRELAGVRRLERYGQRVTLYSGDSDATIQALVTAGVRWKDLELKAADLESAFLELTGGVR